MITFSESNPFIYGPLLKFLSKNYSPEIPEPPEIPGGAFVSLIGTCLKSSDSFRDTLIMENVLKILQFPIKLDIYQVWQIVNNLVFNYPHPKTSLEYLGNLFNSLMERQQPATEVVRYFMKQIKALCTQTLEELSNPQETPRNRYRVGKSKAQSTVRYTLMSEGTISVRVRPGDIILLERLNRKSVELISEIRAVVISTDAGVISVYVSWVPRDITIATWKVKQVGNIIGFKHSMEAFKKLYEETPKLLDILLGTQLPTTTTIENGDDVVTIQELNLSQQTAIYQAENGCLTLWQGPAGTGKTKSIFQLILRLLDRNPRLPILVTAATNAAVDNVALLLVERGIQTIRIGDKNSIHPNL